MEGPGLAGIRSCSFVRCAILVRYAKQFHECPWSWKGSAYQPESVGHESEVSAGQRRRFVGESSIESRCNEK